MDQSYHQSYFNGFFVTLKDLYFRPDQMQKVLSRPNSKCFPKAVFMFEILGCEFNFIVGIKDGKNKHITMIILSEEQWKSVRDLSGAA